VRDTGGSELANTQSFITGLCQLIGVYPPHGSRTDDSQNDYVFERRVFQDNGDGSVSFGRLTATNSAPSSWKQSKEARLIEPRPSVVRTISTCSAKPHLPA
jgi:hypothetical protein